MKYHIGGRPQCVSSHSERKDDAKRLLKTREGDVVKGMPITAHVGQVTFEDAAADLQHDYRTNRRRSWRVVALRLTKHLAPYFAHRRLITMSTIDVRAYTARRLAQGASNAAVNRDLMILKRMCTLAMQAGKLMVRPYIPLLREANIRKGFFEREQFERVKNHLPAHMQGVVGFAHVTGWRTPSEILPLEWRQVDFKAGEVHLDPGRTKTGEARTFPLTTALRRVLEDQQMIAEQLKREHGIIARDVFCYVTDRRETDGA